MKTNLSEINELHRIDLYLHFYEDFVDEKRTKKECNFIIQECSLKPRDRLLDLACGHGRHSIFFAEQQLKTTGVDINQKFIKRAERLAKEKEVIVNFKIDNILNIEQKNEYDCIVLLFNSFGFLDKQDGIILLQKLKSALKEKGKIVIDIKNRDSILRELKECHLTEKGDDLMIDRMSFNPKKGTITNRRIYLKDGVRYDTPFTMQLYNFSEFEEIIAKCGLNINKLYGDWNGNFFCQESRRIITVIENKLI